MFLRPFGVFVIKWQSFNSRATIDWCRKVSSNVGYSLSPLGSKHWIISKNTTSRSWTEKLYQEGLGKNAEVVNYSLNNKIVHIYHKRIYGNIYLSKHSEIIKICQHHPYPMRIIFLIVVAYVGMVKLFKFLVKKSHRSKTLTLTKRKWSPSSKHKLWKHTRVWSISSDLLKESHIFATNKGFIFQRSLI